MFKTLVVAIDGSDPSLRGLEAACMLASAMGSEIHLVHAHDAAREPVDGDGLSVVARASERATALGVAPSSATAVQGDPFEEIMTIVDLYGADLVVTGRRGMGNISGLFAGSTSQKIAQQATCAHLSVK